MQKNYRIRLLVLALFCVALLGIVCLGLNCPIRSLTGIPCPGCGMSRAWLSALRLDILGAFRYHPMFWSVPVLMAYCMFDGRIIRPKWLNWGLLGLIALGVAVRYIAVLVAFFSGNTIV